MSTDAHKHACDTCERTFSCSGERVGFACPEFTHLGFRCPDCWGDYLAAQAAQAHIEVKAAS